MIKKAMIWTAGLRTTPAYTVGERLIACRRRKRREHRLPDGMAGAAKPGWAGMTAHVAGLHLAQLRITERLARKVGDDAFAAQCAAWITAAAEAMEKRLWDKRGYYLNYLDPYEGLKSEFVFGYQLDGEWIADFHGLPASSPKAGWRPCWRRSSAATSPTRNSGRELRPARRKTAAARRRKILDYGPYSFFPVEALMLAMTYMYNGQPAFGMDLAYKVWHNIICVQAMPGTRRTSCAGRGYGRAVVRTGLRPEHDPLVAARGHRRPRFERPGPAGGLVDRVLRAARDGR